MHYSGSIRIIYCLSALALFWLGFTFFYQYIAAFGSLPDILAGLKETRILYALWLSVSSSIVTLLISIILGVAVAFVFATRNFKGKTFLEVLSIDIPQTFPPVAEGMIYLLMIGPNSPFKINLAYTFTALIICKIYICIPFVISLTLRKFKEIQKGGFPISAQTLGANPLQVFFYVYLPMALKEILAGSALCFSRAMGELGASLIFAGVITYKTEIIPTFIAKEATSLTGPALTATILGTTISAIALYTFKKLTRS
jgi:molybdate transport system permease protein